jgi:peroxiredoxin
MRGNCNYNALMLRGRLAPEGPYLKGLVGGLVALGIVFGYLFLTAPEASKVKPGMQAPELELPSRGQDRVRLSEYRGQPVLLTFFMSHCAICEREVPQIERLHRELASRGLMVLGVAVDGDYAAREGFLRRNGITFGVLYDPHADKMDELFGSRKVPESYLIDAGGRIAAVWLGSVDWRSPEVRRRILGVLPAAPAGRRT